LQRTNSSYNLETFFNQPTAIASERTVSTMKIHHWPREYQQQQACTHYQQSSSHMSRYLDG